MTDGNRPVRTRMPGGVGGAGSIPVPTRFCPFLVHGSTTSTCLYLRSNLCFAPHFKHSRIIFLLSDGIET